MNHSKITCDKALLSSLQLFKDVPLEPLQACLEQCEERHVAAGDILLAPNRRNAHVFILLSGRLSVHLDSLDSSSLTTLGPGECVGELSILDKKFPSAYVMALGDVRLLTIKEQTLWEMIDISHGVARNLLYIMCQRMRQGNTAIIDSNRNAQIDALTRLPNRRGLNQMLKSQQRRCQIEGLPLCLIMVDIDYFKRFNDRYGHLKGDKSLYMVAQSIRRHARSKDIVARYGGEEFSIVLPDTEFQEAVGVAETVRVGVSMTRVNIEETEQPLSVTVSLGVAKLQTDESIETLIAHADAALYRAKKKGRNCVCQWHGES